MPDVILVLAKATLLFLAGLAFLWLSKRSAPAIRHLICLCAMGASLAVLLTVFLPQSAIAIHLPVDAGIAMATSAAPKDWPWVEFASAIWSCGCALVLLRLLIGCFALSRVRRSATPFAVGESCVPVFTADVSVPMLTGLFRPVILMPRSAAEWPPHQLSAALRHELAHLERGDLRANFAGLIACAIYWFHPLIWVLARRLRTEQEAACDDAVLRDGFDCAAYAEALVETARRAGGSPVLSCPMADRTGVKARVIRILSAGDAHKPTPPVAPLFAALILALIVVSSLGAERIYTARDGVTAPVVIEQVNPKYTPEARAAKIRGKVSLKLVVGSDGIARDITLVQGIDPGLDQNAIQAIQHWRFRPAFHNATPVAMSARIDVNFRLK
jgi:TonB family protein